MRVPFVALALVAAVAASPFPWAMPQFEGTISAIAPTPTQGRNGSSRGNATATGHHNPHKEPTPTFKLGCDCAKPIIPVDQLSPTEKCEFEFAHAMACYYRAQGGCPSPTLACS